MDPEKLMAEYGMWVFFYINIGLGLVLGLIPLTIGLIKGRRAYGIYGLIACLVGGALLGILLSVPACILFTWLCLRKQ